MARALPICHTQSGALAAAGASLPGICCGHRADGADFCTHQYASDLRATGFCGRDASVGLRIVWLHLARCNARQGQNE